MNGLDATVHMEIKDIVYSAVKQAILDAFKEIEESKKKTELPSKRVGFGGS